MAVWIMAMPVLRKPLVIAGETAEAGLPGEDALHDPSTCDDLKAFCVSTKP
jgi:hypothetical protein